MEVSGIYTGDERKIEAEHVVMVTGRSANDSLYAELCDRIDIARVGDCSAPGIIAAAVMAGHRYAQDMDGVQKDVPFLRDDAEIRD